MRTNFAPHLGLRVGAPRAEVAATPEPAERPRPARPAPVEPTVELAIAFCAWAHDCERFPSTAEVVARFAVSPEAADRWRRALAAQYGVAP